MIASWIESIENSSKTLHSNLPEPTWNIQSINDSNQLIITKPIERFTSSKCSIDHFQYDHDHEINQQTIHPTNFKLNTKSNSNLNKFTISSLLNTEIIDKTKIGSEMIENDNYIHSFQKCNQKQETTKIISNPQCLS